MNGKVRILIETSDEVAQDHGMLAQSAPLRDRVVHALRGVMDPELPVNIFDLGLIYRLDVPEHGQVDIDMTLTAPNCPVAGEMPGQVQAAVLGVEGVTGCKVTLVWTPKWDKSRMSEAALLEMGLF